MADEGEDVKPKINIHVEFEGQTCTMKIRSNTALRKVFEAAEKRFGKEPGTIRFTLNGVRLAPEHTPAELGMEDGDQIDGHLPQVGGSM
ncbi:ubiquitin-related domain-containing protein [Cristinia sonorae]|uniref:Ubiquitin-related domain-containing protein n=1 Tax=Cristinia sonorae TaxID=1940300 RepID=A0A8K0UV14_9AGAR|nr:ubiquitin-related domain-containing protein [Cristinia sonorae]